ncbi:XRE family transcriptional regulator [Saccharothrix syringae]|uniref:XRE family transcriptional regulator n=1 Tax=Saccharothrix syringae TaxID=103733 RepID=A0A5Q0GTU2_SACSY|nr:XRE family transcriptional regulator [Saccharothrix syringae]
MRTSDEAWRVPDFGPAFRCPQRPVGVHGSASDRGVREGRAVGAVRVRLRVGAGDEGGSVDGHAGACRFSSAWSGVHRRCVDGVGSDDVRRSIPGCEFPRIRCDCWLAFEARESCAQITTGFAVIGIDDERLGSTVRSRALGAELRAARHRSSTEKATLVEKLGFSFNWLMNLEQGRRRTDSRNIARLLGAYRVSLKTFERVMSLYRDTDDGCLVWEHGPGGADEVPVVLANEGAAHELFCYEVIAVPVLAQSEDYMRASFGQGADPVVDAVERRVTARLKRQRVLGRRSLARSTFVVHEWTLRHLALGRSAAWGQLMNLFWLGNTAGIDVLVIGSDTLLGSWANYSFTLLHSPEFRPMVHFDVMACSLFLDDPRHVEEYQKAARLLMGNAMSSEDSQALIARLAEQVGDASSVGN